MYRYVSKKELELMETAPEQIGREFSNQKSCNTFYYEKGQRYLHFFKNKRDVDLIRSSYKGSGEKYYICTYNAPSIYLFFHLGKGYYQSANGRAKTSATEFAIQSRYFNPDWLCKVEEDNGQELGEWFLIERK